MLVSCNMHFLTTRKNIAFLYSRIALATFLEEPFISTNNSYRYMFFALVGMISLLIVIPGLEGSKY